MGSNDIETTEINANSIDVNKTIKLLKETPTYEIQSSISYTNNNKYTINWCKSTYTTPRIDIDSLKLVKKQLLTDLVRQSAKTNKYNSRLHRQHYKLCYNIYKKQKTISNSEITKIIIAHDSILPEETITCNNCINKVMNDFFLITKLTLYMNDNLEHELFDINSQVWDILELSNTFNLSIFTQLYNLYNEMNERLAIMNNLHLTINKHNKQINEYTKIIKDYESSKLNQLQDETSLNIITTYNKLYYRYLSIINLSFVNINETIININSYNDFTNNLMINSYKHDVDKYINAVEFLVDYKDELNILVNMIKHI